MATAIVTIICIAMIVVGGMTLSQGILTSTDTTAASVETISVREGEIIRTHIDLLRAAPLSWGDYLRATVKNSGQIKLASYDKWDIIISYEADDSNLYSTWLPFASGTPGSNEWGKARIGLNGPFEYFEPGILNPGEEMVILAHINPLSGAGTGGDVSITTPNGVYDAMSFVNPGYLRLTPQSENVALNNTRYYELVEGATADGDLLTAGAEFAPAETGRKLLYNINDTSYPARFIYPLVGISEIPAQQWTVYYRCYVYGGGDDFPQNDNDISFDIDVLIRRADGTIRTTIASRAASAALEKADKGVWVTITGTYNFPGYTIIDENDYLEIDYYGETDRAPAGTPGYLQISIDNDSLPVNEQTRIEA